jgi:aldehyde:ferredoxin oxidoreductase
MRIVRVNMDELKVSYEALPEEWGIVGGRGLIAKIMNREVPPDADPMGGRNKLIITGGPLAGTLAPMCGRISIGAKSPLTLGIKEANAGGPAAQKLDRLDIRAIIVEGIPKDERLYFLELFSNDVNLLLADEYRGVKNYDLIEAIHKKYGRKVSVISIGIGGERESKGASISLTDIFGDPSRNAGRGGLGSVMGSKGIKAVVISDEGTPRVDIADKDLFKKTVRSWVETLKGDMSCRLFSTFGTPLAVAPNSYQGTMPARNYSSGRPEGFKGLTGEAIKRNVWERGGKYHACMPGCVVQCSIIYNDAQGKRLASAYEYEAIAMLGTNLGIDDPDAVGRLKFMCDDLGLDLIELGSSLGVAASAGKMKMGDAESAVRLIREIEIGTDLGRALADGVVATAKFLGVTRIPAIKGQAIPGHDPRSVKGTGVTYFTSPMGPDHTAGLTYRIPLRKSGQAKNSLRAQIKAATCDTLGYCINALPGGRASLYGFFRDLLNARYGIALTEDDIINVGKETLRDELRFNEGAEFSKAHENKAEFMRKETLLPTKSIFDVEASEANHIWDGLESYREPEKIWQVRFPSFPQILFGAGVLRTMGEHIKEIGIKRALFIADPVMKHLGYAGEVQKILEKIGVASVLFSEVQPDPPVEEIEETGRIFKKEGCDSVVALGGGSSMDVAKATSLRVSQPGILEEYGSMVGGTGKIRPPLPPVICIPTTSGTGSEVNSYSVITDREKNQKFMITSEFLVPTLAVIDPELTKTMPPGLTAQTGVDALAHCVEGFVGMAMPYHPYYEALGLYGIKLVGRSLRKAVAHGDDIDARTDMCMAAIYGGVCFTKGLGLGHAIGHVLGSFYHILHSMAVSVALLCFVRGNQKGCQEKFSDLAYALDHSHDLESALTKLYEDIGMPTRFRDLGIKDSDLRRIAFEASMDVPNTVGNPIPPNESRILELLKAFY